MSQFRCVIQAGSAADERRQELEAGLHRHHVRHYPGEATSVGWVAVPPGYMFTEGRPSTSSVISCTVDHATSLDDREAYLRGVCDLWTEVTHCTDHEVVVAMTDTTTNTTNNAATATNQE